MKSGKDLFFIFVSGLALFFTAAFMAGCGGGGSKGGVAKGSPLSTSSKFSEYCLTNTEEGEHLTCNEYSYDLPNDICNNEHQVQSEGSCPSPSSGHCKVSDSGEYVAVYYYPNGLINYGAIIPQLQQACIDAGGVWTTD